MVRKFYRPLIAAIGLTFAALSVAAPAVLIVPQRPSKHAYSDTEGNLLEMIANSLEEDGRVAPIAWTNTDPIFRSARDAKQVPGADIPSEEMATKAATTLRCEYIMYVSIYREGSSIFSKARLMHKGKEVWLDPKPDFKLIETLRENAKLDPEKKPFDEEKHHYRMMTLTLTAQDSSFDSMKTLAETWTEIMFLEPLKNLKPRPRLGAIPTEGTLEKIPVPPPPDKGNNQELLTKVMALMAKGDRAGAINMMRDAVDSAPLDAERRKVLVEILMASGFYAEAAKQARRSATILEKSAEMYVLAARAWLAADNTAEAQADLKEAVTREPESPAVLALLGEVALRDNQYEQAIKHFSAAIEKNPNPNTYFYRALAYALFGEGAKARPDLEKAKADGLNPSSVEQQGLYVSAIGMVSGAALKNGVDFRDLVQKIRIKPYEKALADELDGLRMRCDALQLFLKELQPPVIHQGSHGERALGIKLVLEAITMMESYLKLTDEDVMSEAQISLGEGLKRLLSARDMFAKESAG